MQENTFITGFFQVDGVPDSVEVPCSGRGGADYAALNLAIGARHPKAKSFIRTGSVVEIRDPAEGIAKIDLDSGLTLRQLFDSPDGVSASRTSLNIGRVFFNSTPCYVMLTFTRAASSVGILLLPRIKMGDTAINFSNKISPQTSVVDLPRIVKEVLGRDARALELNTRRSN